MNSFETYIRSLYAIYASGAGMSKIAYYPPLADLLNEVGHTLKPRVRCLLDLKSMRADRPDGGLFTANQLPKTGGPGAEAGPPGALPNTPPSRGVIEVKASDADIRHSIQDGQIAKYLAKYRQVLVTNYRDFILIGLDRHGRPGELESYTLAQTEADFWAQAMHPEGLTQIHGAGFIEYLTRVVRRAAPLARPEDVAWFLASYAREAHRRLEMADRDSRSELGPLPVGVRVAGLNPGPTPQAALNDIRTALETVLGLAFKGDKGAHFFHATLIQTLFYSIFSAWLLWHHEEPARQDHFDWRLAHGYLPPIIQALWGQLVQPGSGGGTALNLTEVLNWTGDILNRVDRAKFFSRFAVEQMSSCFLEPFWQTFSPELRKELGVWSTPPELARYMVARVDRVLREELGLANGLADERVSILDPCCGSGTYLVEVLRRIAVTLQEQGGEAQSGDTVKKAALERVFGFEIMPASLVIAHLQLGLCLQSLGTPLAAGERVGVYLTNALTGWQPSPGPRQPLMFPALEMERDAAEMVKQDQKILVILGSLPYHEYPGLVVAETGDLNYADRTTQRALAPQGQGLNDLYIRFFRMAERQIEERTGRGVICYISNYAWLDGPSFTGMREHYLKVFDRIWIDNLHGDRTMAEYAPDGRPSETVFAGTGLKVGTAISLLVKKGNTTAEAGQIYYRDLQQAQASERRQALLASLHDAGFKERYQRLQPDLKLGLLFKPLSVSQDYLAWPLLPELFPLSFPGLQPGRAELVVDIDRERLVQRLEAYFASMVSDAIRQPAAPQTGQPTPQADPLPLGDDPGQHIIRYCYRPFDLRWLYVEPETDRLDRKRADYASHVSKGNLWLGVARRNRQKLDRPFVVTQRCSRYIIEHGARLFPLYLQIDTPGRLFAELPGEEKLQSNLSNKATRFLADLGASSEADTLFYHTIATLFTPKYREENGEALRQNWPRLPLPDNLKLLQASAGWGRQLAALLDPDIPVPGVTIGQLRPELKPIGLISRVEGSLEPTDLALTADWGYPGRKGMARPGQSRLVEREYTSAERAAIERGAARLGLSLDQLDHCLDLTTCDVYLNEMTYWANIPTRVWRYTIGGYPVIKTWLADRAEPLLGRPLRREEVDEVMNMARRLTAIIFMEPALDANYQAIKQTTYPWPAA